MSPKLLQFSQSRHHVLYSPTHQYNYRTLHIIIRVFRIVIHALRRNLTQENIYGFRLCLFCKEPSPYTLLDSSFNYSLLFTSKRGNHGYALTIQHARGAVRKVSKSPRLVLNFHGFWIGRFGSKLVNVPMMIMMTK